MHMTAKHFRVRGRLPRFPSTKDLAARESSPIGNCFARSMPPLWQRSARLFTHAAHAMTYFTVRRTHVHGKTCTTNITIPNLTSDLNSRTRYASLILGATLIDTSGTFGLGTNTIKALASPLTDTASGGNTAWPTAARAASRPPCPVVERRTSCGPSLQAETDGSVKAATVSGRSHDHSRPCLLRVANQASPPPRRWRTVEPLGSCPGRFCRRGLRRQRLVSDTFAA